jgi:hypothetical protein
VVIVTVRSQVLCQLSDACRKQGDLDVGGAGVRWVRLVGNRDFSLLLLREHTRCAVRSLSFLP